MPLSSLAARWAPRACLVIGLAGCGTKPPVDRPARPPLITGRVLGNGIPLEQARVRIQGADRHVLTDREGRFTLERAASRNQTVTAAKGGYFIAGQSANQEPIELNLRPIPTQDRRDYAWVDPTPHGSHQENCGNCHQAIYDQWAGGGHARAATNPYVLHLIQGTDAHGVDSGWSLRREHPHGQQVCLPCHAPTAAEQASAILPTLEGVARRGVHCDFCHKIQDVSLPAGGGNDHGFFGFRLLRPGRDGQLFFGPLDDVDRGEDVFSELFSQSRLCAPCHEGTLFGVPVYTTYSEWQASPAAKQGATCQSCHMAPSGNLANVAPGHGGIDRNPNALASHDLLPGGRRAMLQRAVQLTANVIAGDRTVTLQLEIALLNTGHRLPTGFIDRNLILVVEPAEGSPSQLIDGEVLPSIVGPSLRGKPGYLFAKRTFDRQGNGPVPFWADEVRVVDTRLAPGRAWRGQFTFTGRPPLRVRLVYRRFWEQVMLQKQLPNGEVTVWDRTYRST